MKNVEPAVFTPIVASEESIAAMEEEVRRKREREASPEHQRRRKLNVEMANELLVQIKPFVDEAHRRSFRYFRSRVDLRQRATIQLEFADGAGTYYVRTVSIGRLFKKHNAICSWEDVYQISDHIYIDLLNRKSFDMLDHGMKANRVRVNF